MSANFDPYHKWLGILPKDQPPQHYRLLGLETFEEDLQVIEAAADRQLGFLRKFQSGEHAADCQKLLNEISRARLCLLKPGTKADYDQELRAKLAAPAGVAFEFEPEIDDAPVAKPASTSLPKLGPVVWISAGALLLLLVGSIAFLFSGKTADDKPLPPEVAVSTPDVNPSGPKPDPGKTTTDSGKPPAIAKEGLRPLAKGQTNILPLLKSENILNGSWQIKPDRLESLAYNQHAQVALPISVPEEYTLHIQGTRLDHPGAPSHVCVVGLVCGDSNCLFVMEADPRNGVSGLENVDGMNWNRNSTTLPGLRTKVGEPFQLDAIVRKGGIEIRIDGRTIVDWKGNFRRLKRPPGAWDVVDPRQLYLAAESKYVFTEITLGPPLPPHKLPGGDLKPGESVELLKFVDLKQDVWNGVWEKHGLAMKNAPNHPLSRFSVPYQVPDEYELVAEIECEGAGRDFVLGVPFQSGFVGIGVGGGNGESNCLLIDYAAFFKEPHIDQREAALLNGKNRVFVTIRKQHIIVKVNDRTLFDWKGDPRRYIAWPEYANPGQRVTVGTNGFSWQTNSLKLTRLPSGPDAFSKPAEPKNGDLLSIVDVDRDTVNGVWTRTPAGVQSVSSKPAGLRFPAKLPTNYEFRIVVELKEGSGGFTFMLPIAGRPVSGCLDGDGAQISGLNWFEGKRYKENSTTLRNAQPYLRLNQPTAIQGVVRDRHLTLEVAGKKLWDLDVPDSVREPIGLLRPGWLTPEEQLQMLLNAWETSYEVQEVRFRPLDSPSPPFPPLNVASSSSPPSVPVAGTQPDESGGLTAVPDAAAHAAATQKLHEIFKEEFASAKKDADKLTLAQMLESLADESGNDPAAKFVCLKEARKLAAEAGDLTKAFAQIDKTCAEFKVDELELKASTLKSVGAKLKGPLLNKELVDKALPLIEQLVAAEKFDVAVDLGVATLQAGIKVKDKLLLSDLNEIRKETEDLARDYAVASKARETLSSNPEDQASRLVWGQWLCFQKDNWPEGLELLKGAGDDTLKELVIRDLKDPADKEEILRLGTDWLEYAKSRKDHSLADFGTRALYWLSKAHAESTGLAKSRVQGLMEAAVSVRDWSSPVVALLDSVGKKVGQQKFMMSVEVTMRGGGGVPEFRDFPPEGGILIGLNCHLGEYDQGQIVRGVQPVFFTKTGQKLGAWYGPDTNRPVTIRARKGYAISDLSGMPGGETVFRSIQASFAKISKSGLDPRRGYVSPVVGDQRNRDPWMRLGLPGTQPIIGIFGHADNYFRGIGVIFTK